MTDQLADKPHPPLRVGILIDSHIQPTWIESIIKDIQASSFARIELVITNGGRLPEKRWRYQRYWQNRQYLLYAAYNRLDELVTKPNPDAFESTDIEPLVKNIPSIWVEPLMTKFTDNFTDEDVAKIKSYDLDVALRFGFRILKGQALHLARFGVWSYHHGDGAVNRGGPAGFWEVIEGEPVTGAMLQVLTEQLDNGRIIARSWSPTSDKFSARLNRNHYYWKASVFVMRALERIHAKRELVILDEYQPYCNRLYKTPTNSEMFWYGSKLAIKYLSNKVRALSQFNQWSLAYRFRAGSADPNNAFYRFKFMIPPADRFWADPFPVSVDGRYFIFFEEYIYDRGKGHIAVMEVDRKTGYKSPFTVLEKNYHLSYPCVFSWAGNFYMIPETSENRTIELYRCTNFPDTWELETVLFENVNATDATVFESEGIWWMFVNMGEKPYPSDWDELSLFWADVPRGPWHPHPLNPIKSDVRNSRPAGRLFEWNSALYRPAQNSAKFYGFAISINKVKTLTKTDYAEDQVTTIFPRWNKKVIGTHTLNTCEDLTVIDCLRKRNRFS